MLSKDFAKPMRVRSVWAQSIHQPVIPRGSLGRNHDAKKDLKKPKDKKSENISEKSTTESSFRCYCSDTSLHGWKYFFRPGKSSRVYWVLAFLVVYTCVTKYLKEQILEFNKTPVLVSFEPDPTVISSLPLPAITLCPEMQLRTSVFNLSGAIENKNLTDEENELLLLSTTFCDIYLNERPVATDFSSISIKYFSSKHNSYNSCLDFLASFHCSYKQIPDPCLYFQPTFTEHGACFTFNLLPLSQIFRPRNDSDLYPGSFSPTLGLEEIWTPDTGYHSPSKKRQRPSRDGSPPWAAAENAGLAGYHIFLQVPTLLFDPLCSGGGGFHGYLHNPAEMPNSQHTYFYLGPKIHLDIKVEPQVHLVNNDLTNWPPESRKCYMQYERHLAFYNFYTQKNCELECETNFTLKYCQCVSYFSPRSPQDRVCGPRYWDCLASHSHSDDDDKLLCNCLPACSEIDYTASFTPTEKSWTDYYVVNNNFSFEGAVFMSLKVSYRSKYVQAIMRKSSRLFIDVVANVGGILSLFTGFSILSLMEIFYFMFFKTPLRKLDVSTSTEELASESLYGSYTIDRRDYSNYME